MEKTGSKIICGAPMTLAVKGLMMMMMMKMENEEFEGKENSSNKMILESIPLLT